MADIALYPPTTASLAGRGRVTTLGQLVIDHFEAVGGEADVEVLEDPPELGGGGIYAMTAARMFLPPQHVGYVADVGLDFPAEFRTTLEKLGDMVWFRPRNGNTTRALNQYSGAVVGEGHQTFTYLSPTLQLTPSDLLSPPSPFAAPPAEWVHVVCDLDRARAIAKEAEGFRRKGWVGSMAWEPLIRSGSTFSPAQYAAAASAFAVFSPNHIELQTIIGADADTDVETCARLFHGYLAAARLQVPVLVVRAGASGAFTLSPEWTGWVPAFWEDASNVRDPTGGGNAFMGGLLAGLFLRHGDFRMASVFGATAASFAIEQRGIPLLSAGPYGEELWNGVFPWERLRQMASHLKDSDEADDRGSK